MPAPPRGLHETLITEALNDLLDRDGTQAEVQRTGLREAEAADRRAATLEKPF
jgi:hypothetical protein